MDNLLGFEELGKPFILTVTSNTYVCVKRYIYSVRISCKLICIKG